MKIKILQCYHPFDNYRPLDLYYCCIYNTDKINPMVEFSYSKGDIIGIIPPFIYAPYRVIWSHDFE